MGVPAFRSLSMDTKAAYNYPHAIPKPAGVVQGDCLIFVGYGSQIGSTADTPTGGATWVAVGNSGDSPEFSVWAKVAGPSEPATYAWTPANQAAPTSGLVLAYTGTSTPLIGATDFSQAYGTNGGDFEAPSITTSVPAILLCGWCQRDSFDGTTNPQPPAPMSHRSYMTHTGEDALVADEVRPSPGATGARMSSGFAGGMANRDRAWFSVEIRGSKSGYQMLI